MRMNLLNKIRSFCFILFILIFFSTAALYSCGTGDKSQENTEQSTEESTEHPSSEEEHPTGEEEHPSGDEEHPAEDTTGTE